MEERSGHRRDEDLVVLQVFGGFQLVRECHGAPLQMTYEDDGSGDRLTVRASLCCPL